MKPSQLIEVLQEAIDAGCDDTTEIFFDTDARNFNYHMAKIGSAFFEEKIMGTPFIALIEGK